MARVGEKEGREGGEGEQRERILKKNEGRSLCIAVLLVYLFSSTAKTVSRTGGYIYLSDHLVVAQ